MSPQEVMVLARADAEIIELRRDTDLEELRDCARAAQRLYTRIRHAQDDRALSPWAEGHLASALASLQMAAASLELADLEQVKALSEQQMGGRNG